MHKCGSVDMGMGVCGGSDRARTGPQDAQDESTKGALTMQTALQRKSLSGASSGTLQGCGQGPRQFRLSCFLAASLHLAQALVPGSAPCPSSQESRYPSINLIPWISPASPHPPRHPHAGTTSTGTYRSSGAETAGRTAVFPGLECFCLPLQLAR